MSGDKRDKEWFELPRAAGAAKLVQIRNELRAKNLHDTEDPPHPRDPAVVPAEAREGRTANGEFNDLRCPLMGSTGARFGRNVPLKDAFPDVANLMVPNPRDISRELFTRTAFQPATILNVMAAAWIQFQTHDWFLHRQGTMDDAHEIPLSDDDPWPARPMRVPRTPVDPQKRPDASRPPAYVNDNSHWWDGSQIYGSTPAVQAILRTGDKGKVKVGDDCRLGLDPVTGLEVTGMTENAWVALSLLHGLFALEHNAVCDRLAEEYPGWDDQQIFTKARLVISALMAKIHTVEWTPAILPNPLTVTALRTNWYGLLPRLQTLFGGLQDNEYLSGIPGSPTDHHTAPYSLTEEFAAVYRMHSLLPDEFTLWSVETGQELERFELPALSGRAGRQVLERCQVADLLYSFGVSHPGALRLHNFPRHLQQLKKDSGEVFDIAAVDILRDRERGVPRYNQFRRLFHKQPIRRFEELTDNPQWNEEIQRVYGGDLEKVDLLVGLMGEPLPAGFGFSDTAFRVFILMASRRLKSDRFLSQDYTPKMYTPAGIEWVEETSMLDVLRRHVPALGPALAGVDNAFTPWRRVR